MSNAEPVFDWQPERVRSLGSIHNTLITSKEDVSEQRRSKGSKRIRVALDFIVDDDTFEDILDFFDDRQGRFESFEWTDPRDDTEYTMRFDTDELEAEETDLEEREGTEIWSEYDYVYEFSLPMIEVIGED